MRAGPPAGQPSWRSRCKGPWRPASWNCRPQETRSRALRRTSPTCWLTRAGSCQRAPAASLSPPAKMAKAGLPRQYDVGGPSQPTGRLQGKVLGPALANRSCYGLDITTEARPIASPRLTASVLAMFETRVKLLENKRGRGRVEGKPRSFVQKCKSHI